MAISASSQACCPHSPLPTRLEKLTAGVEPTLAAPLRGVRDCDSASSGASLISGLGRRPPLCAFYRVQFLVAMTDWPPCIT
jgi:hypothetical protein